MKTTQEQFINPEKGEHPLLKATMKQRPVETEKWD
jgi:hypothetical protein